MLRSMFVSALALSAAFTPVAAQDARHPLVGRWNLAIAPSHSAGASSTPAVLTIAQRGDALMATLELPAADPRTSEAQRVHGIVVGDSVMFSYRMPTRVPTERGARLRMADVQWTVAPASHGIVGAQIIALPSSSDLLTAKVTGTRSSN